MKMTQYAAVTGDLVASRKASPEFRAKVQRETIKALEELNSELGGSMTRPAALSAGDEIQALFHTPSQVVRFVQVLKDRLYGAGEPFQEIVFGVGWGELSFDLLPEATSVGQLDGPCFHMARETLNLAKKKKTWARFRGFGTEQDRTLSSLFELMGAIRSGWTATQSWYASELRELGETGKRIDVARKLKKTPSVITESLQLSHFDAVMNGEKVARMILAKFDPSKPDSGGPKE